MTKNFILTLITFFWVLQLQAQIPNPGFETLDSNGISITSWFNNNIFAIGLNDSILTDNGIMIQKSTDAHSGTYAIELRNSYNVTQGVAYPGIVNSMQPDTNTYQSFVPKFPLSFKPYALSFFYKMIQNPYQDSTSVTINIYNNKNFIIGKANAIVWDIDNVYKEVTMPIQYLYVPPGSGDSTPFNATISIGNRINNAAGIHVGQRVLIDDLNFTLAPLGVNEINKSVQFTLYPNPAQDKLNISTTDKTITTVEIKDALGHIVYQAPYTPQIYTASWPSGMYILGLYSGKGVSYQRWLKY